MEAAQRAEAEREVRVGENDAQEAGLGPVRRRSGAVATGGRWPRRETAQSAEGGGLESEDEAMTRQVDDGQAGDGDGDAATEGAATEDERAVVGVADGEMGGSGGVDGLLAPLAAGRVVGDPRSERRPAAAEPGAASASDDASAAQRLLKTQASGLDPEASLAEEAGGLTLYCILYTSLAEEAWALLHDMYTS